MKVTILLCVFSLVTLPVVIKCDEDDYDSSEVDTGEGTETTSSSGSETTTASGSATTTTSGSETTTTSGSATTTTPGSATTTLAPSTTGTSGLAHNLLQFLNDARKEGSLESLIWDEELAKKAQETADTCVKTYEKYNFDGILAYINKPENEINPQKVVKNWFRKKKNVGNGDSSACCGEMGTTCCRYVKIRLFPVFRKTPIIGSHGSGYLLSQFSISREQKGEKKTT